MSAESWLEAIRSQLVHQSGLKPELHDLHKIIRMVDEAIGEVRSTRTIDNITEVYIFASNGYVNTAKRGEANTTQTRKTAEVTLAVGQRMVIERGDGVMRLEVLPVGERT
jgi:hypothetical protein